MNTEWECPLCRTANLVPAPSCRVCRTAWPGIRAGGDGTVEGEGGLPPFLSSVPAPAVLVAIAVMLFLYWEPVTRPFSVPAEHSGWTGSGSGGRRDELRASRHDLSVLVSEMRKTLTEEFPLSDAWNDRLSASRQRWQIYGEHDRAPRLGAAEVKLHAAVLELASIRFQLSTGISRVELAHRLDAVSSLLDAVSTELNGA